MITSMLLIGCAGIGLGVYLLIRNNRVYELLIYINQRIFLRSVQEIKAGNMGYDLRKRVESHMPEYNSMLLSFRRVKLENYLPQELIDELQS